MKVTIEKNQKCPICKVPFLNEEMNLVLPITQSSLLGAVHQICFYPYQAEKNIKLLVETRCFSIGDTIAATPIIRELKRIYPDIEISVMTLYPDLFKYNPKVSRILDANHTIFEAEVDSHHFKVNTFKGEGGHCATHSVEFAAFSALDRSIYPSDWGYEVFYSENDKTEAMAILRAHGIDPDNDKAILIHPHGTEWKTRDWGRYKFQELATEISKKYPEYKLVSIGGKRVEVPSNLMDNYVPIEEATDLYGKLTLLQSMALMDLPCSKLIVTPDTGTLHIAGTCPEIPIVGIFTLIMPFFRTPTRRGQFGYKFYPVSVAERCNCTYSNKSITNETYFGNCPKIAFFDKTKRINIPLKMKKEGLRNAGITHRFDEKNLPCFPDVKLVLDAIDLAISELDQQ